jgi:CRISPR/Cas system-associated endoribonuclease Cas2
MAGRRNGKVGSSGRWMRAKRGSTTLWQFAGERGLFYFYEMAPGQRVVLYQDHAVLGGTADKVGTFASPGQARAAVATLEKYGTRSRPRTRANAGGRRRNAGAYRYKVVGGFDHYKGTPLYQVSGVNNDYVGEWHTTEVSARKELKRLADRSRKRTNAGGRRRNAGGKTQHYIIVYDVKDKDPNVASSRRKALHHRLTKWMQPVQRSVMEAALTKAELGKVIDVASSVLNLSKDTFKVFLQQNKRPVVVLGTAQDLSLLAIKKSKLTSPMSYKFKQGSKYASNPRRNGYWKPPTLTQALARKVAKRLDKDWTVHVSSLQYIRKAIGSGVAAGMSMSDMIDNQAAIKKISLR